MCKRKKAYLAARSLINVRPMKEDCLENTTVYPSNLVYILLHNCYTVLNVLSLVSNKYLLTMVFCLYLKLFVP